jgi:hypothetical protein
MKQLKSLIPLFILGLFLFFGACQKKEEVKIDPCVGVKKADFKIYEQVSDSLFESDKALLYNFVEFKANEDYESYSWTIGDDDRIRTTKKVRLYFADPTPLLQIRLIAKRKPRPDCLPNDKGIDTIVKTFQAVDYSQSLILGKFQGFSKEGTPLTGNSNDVFVVDIYHFSKYTLSDKLFVVDNFKKGNYPRYPLEPRDPIWFSEVGYRAIWGKSSATDFKGWEGWHVLNRNGDSITISGIYDHPLIKKIEFKGKRI